MKRACFIGGEPGVELLQKVDVSLKVLAGRGGLDGLLVAEVVEAVPELQGKVFQDSSNTELPLAEGEGENNNIFLQLGKLGGEFLA